MKKWIGIRRDFCTGAIVENGGIAIGFGVRHSCSVWFEGAPKEFYYLTIEPGRPAPGAREVPCFFSSLPPWWNANPDDSMLEPAAVPADEPVTAVEGVLLQLNPPGSITVVISLGADDGVHSGDILTILRKGKPIGRLKVSKVERDRSTAIILAVEDVRAFEVGDEVTKQNRSEGPTRLLGEWKAVSMVISGSPVDRFNFEGTSWTLGEGTLDILPATINQAVAAEVPLLRCSYTVDNTRTPAHFNWMIGEGEKSVMIQAVYELNDDVLRVCFPQHGEPRPNGFESQGQKWTVYEFKRVLKDASN